MIGEVFLSQLTVFALLFQLPLNLRTLWYYINGIAYLLTRHNTHEMISITVWSCIFYDKSSKSW